MSIILGDQASGKSVCKKAVDLWKRQLDREDQEARQREDEWKAKRKRTHESTRRVPEKTLFLLSILGGSVGALLGMRVWHHKTLHKSFRFGIPIIFLCQVLLALGLFLYFRVIR